MEIEAKLKLKNPGKLRNVLKSAGASFHGRAREKNWLYDYPDRSFARTDKLLRLREDRRIRLTFKGPRQDSEYKERDEIEFDFPDLSFAHGLIRSLGFIKWLYYEKLRETWALDPCEIVIDELPHLGVFVEVEGPTREAVQSAVKKLKLPRRFITATYVEMLQEHARQAHGPTQDFKFPSRHTFILGEETSVAS